MARSRSSSAKLAIFLVIVIVAVGALAGFFGPLSTVITALDTTTHTFDFNGAYGGGATGNCLPGADGCATNGMLLDSTSYVAAYSPNQIGQRATAIGAIKLQPNECTAGFPWTCVGINIPELQLLFYLKYPNMTGRLPGVLVGHYIAAPNQQLVQAGKWYQVINSYWDIIAYDGKTIIPSGSVLTVVLQAHVQWVTTNPFGIIDDKGWGAIANVQSTVISGIGSVYFSNPHTDAGGGIFYITGETVNFVATVGYVTPPNSNVPAWNVYAYCQASNSVVFGPKTITSLTQSFSFTLPDACFSTQAPNNELLLQLNNALYNYDFKVASTVRAQDVSHMPTCTAPTVSPQSPMQGDAVTLSFSCTPASSNASDQIKQIKVEWGYGTIQNTVFLGPSATSYQIVASESGYLLVAITAYTVNNVPSGTTNTKIQIDHQVANECLNNAPSCQTGGGGGFIWIILLALGVIAAAAAVFLPADMKAFRIRPFMRIILAIVAVFLLIGAWLVYPG